MRSLLIIGDPSAPEARETLADVLGICRGWRAIQYGTIDEAISTRVRNIDLILVLQTRPSEYSSPAAGRLYNAFPLSRLLVGLGIWCGSAIRREHVWPEAIVVPIWDVAERLRKEIAVIEAGAPGLPITASREERITRLASVAPARLPAGMPILVESPDRAIQEWLTDLVREAGGTTLPEPTTISPGGVIWDADPWNDTESIAKSGWRRCTDDNNCPIVALSGLPTISVVRQLRAAGATAVLAKPCDGQHVIHALGGS